MRKDSDLEWRDLNDETRHGFWYAARWVVAVIILVVVVSAALWAAGVFSAGTKGAGEAHKTNQSAPNRIAKQELFESLYADIQTADKRIDTMAAALKLAPVNTEAQVRYTGAVTYCQQIVGQYNAEARKFSSFDWRDNQLPSSIDQTKPEFDCKETGK